MDKGELLEKIFSRQEKIIEDVSEIKVIQARHEVNLQEHMRRSDTMEQLVQQHREEFHSQLKEQTEQVKPIIAIYDASKKIAALLGILGTIATIIYTLMRIFSIIS